MRTRSIVIALATIGVAAAAFVPAAAPAGVGPAVAGPGAGVAAPAAVPAADPSPTPVYRFVGDYSIAGSLCMRAGQNGVANGSWDAFQCRPRLVGLDTFWSLWVTP
jgi:hypothetical protein